MRNVLIKHGKFGFAEFDRDRCDQLTTACMFECLNVWSCFTHRAINSSQGHHSPFTCWLNSQGCRRRSARATWAITTWIKNSGRTRQRAKGSWVLWKVWLTFITRTKKDQWQASALGQQVWCSDADEVQTAHWEPEHRSWVAGGLYADLFV